MLKLKRAYDPASKSDGLRILVDRLWPRGTSKEKLKLHSWEKDIAPSTPLRKWFSHDPKHWEEFRKRYKRELQRHKEDLRSLRTLAKKHTVTLVYGAKDPDHTHALVLREVLEKR